MNSPDEEPILINEKPKIIHEFEVFMNELSLLMI